MLTWNRRPYIIAKGYMEKNFKEYEVGDAVIDGLISELAGKTGSAESESFLREILTTAVKFGKESGDKEDLKLINNTLKELRYSFKIFSPYRHIKKSVIFGSARSKNTSAEYLMAEEFARKLTKKGWMIVTGGGPGVMEAGNKGAKTGEGFALTIRLPMEQKTNPYILEKEKIINFKYFFNRKLIFIKETDATVLFPGGFGTQDEGFEMLTLIQTGKSRPRPIVLMEPNGSTYWADWMRFVNKQLVKTGYISKEDINLFCIAKTPAAGVKCIEDFYRVYHSIRFVSGLTVLRLNKKISAKTLKLINKRFKGILTSGEIKLSPPTEKEMEEGEFVDLPRIAMNFNMCDYGRLCEMIRIINRD